ncbi:MAG: nitrate reductase molybdenum cofactor assembly chaperone [Rhodospirillaceae bacterium]|nr:nitrate reductase molybdenum cofactor assembly chaperone [Rhodospirillaceae bacterium]
MIATYKALSIALCYPTPEMRDGVEDLIAALQHEALLPHQTSCSVSALLREIALLNHLEAQSRYVELFDRTRALSLHLFEHVHGESRDRGQAMVSLLDRYRDAGLDMTANELPDYIPAFLEFLSLLPAAEARAMLAETVHILSALEERLRKRESPYAAVFEALVILSASQPDQSVLAGLAETEMERPSDLAALDRAWEEAEVRFGPDDGAGTSCPRAADIVHRMSKEPLPSARNGRGASA